VVLLPGWDVGMGLAHGSADWVWGLLRGNLVFMPVMLAVRGAMSRAGTQAAAAAATNTWQRPGGSAARQVVWWECGDE
jgi:hypothetical protein